MATLTGKQIENTYPGLLKTSNESALDVTTEKTIEDGLGNASTLTMSQTSASFSGTLDLSAASVNGLPEPGLVNGTGSGSLQSADNLTAAPANASGDNAIAIGNGALADKTNGIAIGNGNTGFGGAVGGSTLEFNDDGTTITGTFTKGAGDLNDIIVIYISNGSNGRNNVSFDDNDQSDDLRRAVTNAYGQAINFPAGFQLTHAIAIKVGSDALFSVPVSGDISTGGSNNDLNFLGYVGNPNSNADNSFTFSFDWSDIGLTSLDSFGFVVTYGNGSGGQSNDAMFSSDEGYGNGIPTPNPGFGGWTYTTYFEYESGNIGVAIGTNVNTFAFGNSLAIGNQSKALGNESAALGFRACATATRSIAIGNSNATSTGSISIGHASNVNALNAVALGCGVTATKADTVTVKEIETCVPGGGLTLTTPDGLNQYKVTVDNSGNLVTTIV